MKIKGKFVIKNLKTKEYIIVDNFGLFPCDDSCEGKALFVFNPNIYPIVNKWLNQDVCPGLFISKYDIVFDINIYDITGCPDGEEENSWIEDKPCIEIKNAYISLLNELQCGLTYDWYFIHYDYFLTKEAEETKLNTKHELYHPELCIPIDIDNDCEDYLDEWDYDNEYI